MRKILAAVLVAFVFVAAAPQPASAQKAWLMAVRQKYNLDESKKCQFCHSPKKANKDNMNVFGKAIQSDADLTPLKGKKTDYNFSAQELAAFLKIVEKLETADADSDGATNGEEINLGTYPGDPGSKPAQAKLDDYRKKKSATKK